jgi:hypothetical protein
MEPRAHHGSTVQMERRELDVDELVPLPLEEIGHALVDGKNTAPMRDQVR